MQIIIDTSILIDFLRSTAREETRFAKIIQQGHQPAISIIVHTELYAGKSIWEREEARYELQELCSGLEIISLTESISERAGQLRALFGLGLFDAIIAATALEEKCPLATMNGKHFSVVPNLELL